MYLIFIIHITGLKAIGEHSYYQQQFDINIWAGIIADKLTSTFLLLSRLTAAYCDGFRNELSTLLNEVYLNIERSIWLMHDGTPPRFSRETM